MNDLKYLNAINILAFAKPGALQKVSDFYGADWKRAWNSNLAKFLPKDAPSSKTIDPSKEWQKLEKENISLVTILDKDYPPLLKQTSDPPYLLYVRGTLEPAHKQCFGVVGTRAISEYGKRVTPHITLDIARAGFTIVSGLAAGVDTLAHKTAIEAGTPTIAVLGCGIDDATVFPAQNINLARKIVEKGGAVISEYAPGAHATKFSFPQRNRIVSGLSQGVLVVEADEQSGAIITAKCALDQNRDVFAIPGSIFSKTSIGTNDIIKTGAKLVTSANDILEEYQMVVNSKQQVLSIKPENENEEKILSALTDEPITANDLVRVTGLEPSVVNSTIMIMELNKKIKDIGHGKFVSL